jgi:hypothetical protein
MEAESVRVLPITRLELYNKSMGVLNKMNINNIIHI